MLWILGYTLTPNGLWAISYHTTADFEYCPVCGTFVDHTPYTLDTFAECGDYELVSIDTLVERINKFESEGSGDDVYYLEYSIVAPEDMGNYINPISKLNPTERCALYRVVRNIRENHITANGINNAKAIMQSIIKKQTSIVDKIAWLTVFTTGCWWDWDCDEKQLGFDLDSRFIWDCATKWTSIKRNFRRHRKLYTNTDAKSCKGRFSIY